MMGDQPDAQDDLRGDWEPRVIVYPDRTDAFGAPVSTFSAILESPSSPNRPVAELLNAPDL